MLGLRGWPEFIVGLIILDMLDYWWHRFNHRVPFLWRFHKVHHVDTHVDVTTSLRFHPGELLISGGVKAVWILALGPSILAFSIFESAVSLASQFHHSNIDFSDRVENPLRKCFVTPRYHASHHTVCRRTGDANFSTIFIFWDKLFKTYREPDYEEMKTLGLERGREDYLSFATTLKGPFSTKY
jgi:sterol desaturase/sphingolipid hydroxylase (fatty acid hydroxylase superfamily)